ncbi:hypothetical protein D1007_44405 [Hordeum vulgare]|nr:hypothetical protein D1007_44405 [Hordeum vulgare]
MPVEPAFDEAMPMMIDVPVRHADSDEDSDDEAPPSVVFAAMENLNVLFSDLRLSDGPRYFGEDFYVEALCASFSRLSIAEMPAHDVYPSNVLVFDGPPSSVGFFTPYHVATVSNVVEYFIDGSRDGILLKHKLMCSEPTSLAVLIAMADKYATTDSAMRVKVTASDKVVPTPATPKPAGDSRGSQNNNKRKADQLDSCSNNKLVASSEGEASASQAGSQRKRSNRGNTNCLPKQTFEQLLDAPRKIHSGAQPSTHTLRQCSFARRLSQGEGLPAALGAQAAPQAPGSRSSSGSAATASR